MTLPTQSEPRNVDLAKLWDAYHLRVAGPNAGRYDGLRSAMWDAWSVASAHPQFRPPWKPEQPWYGQDDVTALLVYQMFGGVIMVVETTLGMRYWNYVLGDGRGMSHLDAAGTFLSDGAWLRLQDQARSIMTDDALTSALLRRPELDRRLTVLRDALHLILAKAVH